MRTQGLVPLSLTDEFAMHEQKNLQWSGFKCTNALQPMKLVAVIEALREFLLPVLSALAAGSGYNRRWRAGVGVGCVLNLGQRAAVSIPRFGARVGDPRDGIGPDLSGFAPESHPLRTR